MIACSFLALLSFFALNTNAESKKIDGNVVVLTDLNFDRLVNSSNPWMIDIYAPWCPACQEMEPVWRKLSEELYPEGILFGKVDGTKEVGLVHRFSIRHYPSIYHLHVQETREYMGPRTHKDLKTFARGGWRNVEPITGCSSPVSRCGRWLGEVSKVPSRVKVAYLHLKEERNYSDVSLLAGLLAVPVAVGLMLICLLDVYYSRIPLAGQHVHQE